MPASSSMRSNRRCMNDGRCAVAGSSITRTGACNTSRSNTPSAWPRPASSPRSAASATLTTTHTTQDEQVRQGVDDVGRVELAIDADCKAFPGELVDDVEHAVSPAIVGPTLDKVIGPDMVRVLGPQ